MTALLVISPKQMGQTTSGDEGRCLGEGLRSILGPSNGVVLLPPASRARNALSAASVASLILVDFKL